MSTRHITELPDRVYGSADVGRSTDKNLEVSASETSTGTLLHAHIGGIYIAMSERNWRHVVAALQTLEVTEKPRTFRIVFDDDAKTATPVLVTE